MPNVVEGQVAEIDSAGRLITDISSDQVDEAPKDDRLTIKFGGHETVGLFTAEHNQPDCTMVASVGDSGCIEIEIVGMNLSEMLGIGVGTKVEINW